jgi:glucosylceramidase
VQTWDSCIYSHQEQRDFVRDHLGPCLTRHGLSDIKLLVWDHNKDAMVACADAILGDKEAARFVWGVGFHWYSGDDFDQLAEMHRKYPDKHLVFTEGCQEGGVRLGSWSLGERYGHAIIGDLNNWTTGWIDWNMLLDQHGGPNHAHNFCDAPIIADTENDVVHFQSAYYYIGHFSRYFVPGSRVLETVFQGDAGLEGVACLRPDGTIAAVVQNAGEETQALELTDGVGAASVEIPGRAIVTLLLE